MKQIFLIVLTTLAMISCQKQRDTYLIVGNVSDIPDSTIINLFIVYENMGQSIGTDTIINGKFEFSDTLETRPSKMNLMIRDRENFYGSCDLWVDNEVIEITGKGKYLSAWTVKSNVKEQIALNHLNSKTREYAVMMDSLLLERMNNRENRDLSKQIMEQVDSIQQIILKIKFGLIEEDPNSKSALEMLYSTAKFDTTIEKSKIRAIYDQLDTVYQNTLYGEGILSILEEKDIPEIGDEMVNFVAHDVEGNEHTLEEYKGKYILLDFWAMACGPCIFAIPETKKLQLGNEDILTIVGVNMVSNEDAWKEASERDSITWVNLSDGKGTFAGISADYGIEGFPTYILVDPNGIIVEKWMGYWQDVFKQKLSGHIEDLEI